MKDIFKQKKYVPYLILIGVIIVPLLYSYFYLGAFWDPYSSLKDVPVAIVNEDTGAMIKENYHNLGEEMCDRLKNDATLNFIFTDASAAENGLKGKKFYATITIPSNFSEDIASLSEPEKQTATITYSSNEKRNYLATQILNTAVAKIEASVRSTVNEEIVSTLSNNLKETPEKLTTLSEGLTKLQNGTADLKNGTSSLKDGAGTLNEGMSTLITATTSLKEGANSLKEGANSLKTGANQLVSGSTTLKLGLISYGSKWTEFTKGLETVKEGSLTIKTSLETLNQGLEKLESGAVKLDTATNGLSSIVNGSSSLATGVDTLQNSITSYTQGVDSLLGNISDTTQALAAYAKQTGDPTITKIVANLTNEKNIANLNALKNASSALNTGVNSLSSGIHTLSDGAQNLTQLKNSITELKNGLISAKQGATSLALGAGNLNAGLNTLYSAGGEFTKATSQLTIGATSLNNGLSSLTKGIDTLAVGSTSLYNGADKLNNGASSLGEGMNTLISGVTTLDDGASQLKDGITTANEGVKTSINSASEQLKALEGLDTYVGNPVTVESKAYEPVPNYGTAFAPYFMSLSLWVGGLMIFFGIYFDPDCRFKILSRRSNQVIKRTFAYLIIGLLQAILLCIVLLAGLGLNVQNIPLYFISSCLVSMVFIAIIQLLLLFFSNMGKFLAILLLILQLTSCGGTFPMETVPKLFNVLYPFMPMTYSVGLFKEAISGTGNTSLILYNSLILLGILAVTIGLTILFAILKRKNEKNEYPFGDAMPESI
ncbi:YhgE/Pip domain-containing protein [Lachnoclostridium phytofermentans]|uniref:ABC-2 type transporter transmembrane domain-containing protein n=1 Tax=Lachnoclostridium phytofermentans (strain ATCC 700394 / DSM 18823 / ISDg) TaxID=357809 RepID=A9KIZ7_LACP7|nr:YhgE/Pip domain-containing protein [Lachnoclostridium phytofermentans]ABX40996.1 conserved hypothetical protein [Lachnoclostridium phytofermentans ISDg]